MPSAPTWELIWAVAEWWATCCSAPSTAGPSTLQAQDGDATWAVASHPRVGQCLSNEGYFWTTQETIPGDSDNMIQYEVGNHGDRSSQYIGHPEEANMLAEVSSSGYHLPIGFGNTAMPLSGQTPGQVAGHGNQ